jgi:hypothetical protein
MPAGLIAGSPHPRQSEHSLHNIYLVFTALPLTPQNWQEACVFIVEVDGLILFKIEKTISILKLDPLFK